MSTYDIVVVGAGPAGLAAAHAAAGGGASVALLDDNPASGGQIWRGGAAHQPDQRARRLWRALQAMPNLTVLLRHRVLYAPQAGQLRVQTPDASVTLDYGRLILATGARERLLPFPGWTLPGVTGAGGLQALAKGGYPVEGKRVVVAGSGPLLLAVAATLRDHGAHIAAIVEQAGTPALARFALGLLATPSKLAQAAQLGSRLRGVPYWRGSHVSAAHGGPVLEAVLVRRGDARRSDARRGDARQTEIACDHLACGYGLLPNLELAQALGCATDGGAVTVDQWQQTSRPYIYCAGDGSGVGGADLALAEGSIAGLAASGLQESARQLFAERARWRRFAARLAHGFALHPELKALADDATIVCRCEDVRHGELRQHASWRSAKLHTRCGMGPCQGRVCGAAAELLYGWRPDTVRLPLSPARLDSLIDITD